MEHEAEFEALAAELEANGCPGFELHCNIVYDARDEEWIIVIWSTKIGDPYSLDVPNLELPEKWILSQDWYEAGNAGGMLGAISRREKK